MRFGVCNELFGELPFETACRLTAQYGFRGIEVAPYTLSEDPAALSSQQVRRLRSVMSAEGLQCIGLHWLLAAPRGLHITTADQGVRQKSWAFMEYLVDLCAALGGSVMVLGSGKQRRSEGDGREAALGRLKEGLARVAQRAGHNGVKILVEALPSRVTDILNTLSEVRSLVDEIGSPWVRGIFDFHNCDDESSPWHALISEHYSLIEHVHLNTEQGEYPVEMGPAYRQAFNELHKRRYDRWVSLEIFDFDRDPHSVLSATRGAVEGMNLETDG
jgi:sugar phosphate isomerase/epimerase